MSKNTSKSESKFYLNDIFNKRKDIIEKRIKFQQKIGEKVRELQRSYYFIEEI
jgi:hypothetical protein